MCTENLRDTQSFTEASTLATERATSVHRAAKHDFNGEKSISPVRSDGSTIPQLSLRPLTSSKPHRAKGRQYSMHDISLQKMEKLSSRCNTLHYNRLLLSDSFLTAIRRRDKNHSRHLLFCRHMAAVYLIKTPIRKINQIPILSRRLFQ